CFGAARLAGSAGEGEEHVVEIRGVDAEVLDLEVGRVEAVEHGAQRADPAIARYRERESGVIASGVVEESGCRLECCGIPESKPDVPAGHEPLELVWRALCHDAATIEHGDAVGECVRLLELLGGEQHGRAVGYEAAHDIPHGVTAARV